MQTIGERLEEARKKKGISIREAAEATKIRGDYLSKFESNQFDIGLTELYVRGFLRTYAQFLRVPSERVLNDYSALGRGEKKGRQPSREIYGKMDVTISSAESGQAPASAAADDDAPAPAAAPARRSPHTPRRNSPADTPSVDPALVFKGLKFAGGVALVILLVWGAIALFRSATGGPHAAGTAATASPAPAQTTATAPTRAAPSPTLSPLDQSITLVALDTVRVKVVNAADNSVILPDTTLSRGQTLAVAKPASPIYITYSAGENLEVEINGKRYPMPSKGWDKAQIK